MSFRSLPRGSSTRFVETVFDPFQDAIPSLTFKYVYVSLVPHACQGRLRSSKFASMRACWHFHDKRHVERPVSFKRPQITSPLLPVHRCAAPLDWMTRARCLLVATLPPLSPCCRLVHFPAVPSSHLPSRPPNVSFTSFGLFTTGQGSHGRL